MKKVQTRIDAAKTAQATLQQKEHDLNQTIMVTSEKTPEGQAKIAEARKAYFEAQRNATDMARRAAYASAQHEEELARRSRIGTPDPRSKDKGNLPFDPNAGYWTVPAYGFHRLEGELNQRTDGMFAARAVVNSLDGSSGANPNIGVRYWNVQGLSADQEQWMLKTIEKDQASWEGEYHPDDLRFSRDGVVRAALSETENGPYVSNADSSPQKPSTSNRVKDRLMSDASLAKPSSKEAWEDERDVVTYAKHFPGDNAFAQKMRGLAQEEWVAASEVGVVASAVPAWRKYAPSFRHPEKVEFGVTPEDVQRARAYRAQQGKWRADDEWAARPPRPSEHVGTVGFPIRKRFGRVKYARNFWSPQNHSYGTNLILEDEEGNIYKWASSKKQECASGDRVMFLGTVREHQTYEGTKQTVLTKGELGVDPRVFNPDWTKDQMF